MNDCVFCEKVREGSVWSTANPYVLTFAPLNPVVEGHRLFIPRRHVPNAASDPWLTGVVMQQAAAFAARLPAFNLITSTGAAAIQSVFHLCVHVVPRTEDDGLHLPWTAASPTP